MRSGSYRWRPALEWLVLAALLGLGFLPAIMVRTNADIAWLLYAARRITEGATLYVDLIEINPPLIVWLSVPATRLADLLGTSDMIAFLWLVLGLAVASLALGYAVVRRGCPEVDPSKARGILALLALAAVGLSGSIFGQREHVMLLATIPYALLIVVRCRGGAVAPALAIVVGIVAGVGLAIKPHFYLLWIGLEAVLAWRRSQIRVFRPESLAVAGVSVAYLVAVLLFAPEYLTIVDRLGAAYAGHRQVTYLGILEHPIVLALAVGIVYLRFVTMEGFLGELVRVAACSAVVLLVVVALQGQGFYYHYYPVLAWTIVLMATEIWGRGGDGWREWVPWTAAALMLVGLVGLALTGTFADDERTELDRRVSAAADYLRAHTEGDSLTVGVVSPQHLSAYPLMNRVHGRSVFRFNGFWPFTVLCDAECREKGTYLDGVIEPGNEAEAFTREGTLEDLRSDPPDFLVFDEEMIEETFPEHPFNYVGYFAADPAARQVLSRYLCTARVGGYLICPRRSTGPTALPPSPGAPTDP